MATIFTIGHSTRSVEELIELLRAHGVRVVIDVRRHPGSRRHPQFATGALAASLRAADIDYVNELELGGRRKTHAGSPNDGWRSASFRGYADHLATPAFQGALARVVERAEREPCALMCAEAVPWRCHRQLIADVLVSRGHEVRHVLSAHRADPHVLNPMAHVADDGTLTYPAASAPS